MITTDASNSPNNSLLGSIVGRTGQDGETYIYLLLDTVQLDRSYFTDQSKCPDENIIRNSTIQKLAEMASSYPTLNGYVSIDITDLYTFRHLITDSNLTYEFDRFYPVVIIGDKMIDYRKIQYIKITKIDEIKEAVERIIGTACGLNNFIGALEYSLFYTNILSKL